MDAIPEYLRPHILAKIEYEQTKLCVTAAFMPQEVKLKKNGQPRKVTAKNKKFNEMFGLGKIKSHCTLGVKPIKHSVLEESRSRSQEVSMDFSSHCLELFFRLCCEEKTYCDEETLFTFKKSARDPLQTVKPEDQYDFFNSQIKIDDNNGTIRAYGEIPRADGKHDYLPMRRPHLWMELFRRGFEFERPGPLGIHEPWIVYDLSYLRFLSQLGKQQVLDFFNETGLCVCRDILQVLVRDVITIESKKGPDFSVKNHLGSINHSFNGEMFVFLCNGIGIKRSDGRASKLNISVLVQYAISNFGWGNKILNTEENADASKAAPALTIFQLFRWSEAVFRIRHGIESESKIVISAAVKSGMEKALGRKHALIINEHTSKRRFVCKSLQHFKIEPQQIDSEKAKKTEPIQKAKKNKPNKTKEPDETKEPCQKTKQKHEETNETEEPCKKRKQEPEVDFLKDNKEWDDAFDIESTECDLSEEACKRHFPSKFADVFV